MISGLGSATRSQPLMRSVFLNSALNQSSRNMATLREIQTRLKSVTNIAKITKSMKMIASTKTTRAQRAMEQARQNGIVSNDGVKYTDVKDEEGIKKIVIVSSSDKGLCGGIHSCVSRFTRDHLATNPGEKVVVIGDKAKAQIIRMSPGSIVMNFNQVGKLIPTFEESSAIATEILNNPDTTFDCAQIVYNKFISAISYEPEVIPSFTTEYIQKAPSFAVYEIPDGVLENYNEFLFATNLHWALVEGHATEMAAKRAAMDNATNNAEEIIGKLTLQYNRGRQALITNQLIEVITGASAL
ncbi:hypothetical protein BB560_003040 [Smittium megazygosporum]|uniref:ATP synthase subunit gamma n=1 Tax=Smittium megazygosporum TaxID=133381 RepID=A0A2T9ZD30_9FUNG|nr:hypothetical protein BB560_003040 [Smittium megazygosporum]